MAEPVSPVISGLEPYEIVFEGGDDSPFMPLPALRGRGPQYMVSSRWRPTAEERKVIAAGGDIIITQWTFGNPYQATSVAMVINRAETPEEVEKCKNALGLDDELNERLNKLFS